MTFPVSNIVSIVSSNKEHLESKGQGDSTKGVWYAELLIRHVRLSTYLVLSLLYYYSFDISRAQTWAFDWVFYLWLRNIVTEVTLYGGWHFFLYEWDYVKAKMHGRKFNPKWPKQSQHIRDALWTTSGFTISTLFEALMYHAWATGQVPMMESFWSYPLYSIFNILVIPYWRDFHFWCIHRFMHPWKTTTVPDVGKWMYDNVHYLHHKSYNTGPFSGLAMHPIEHLFYYTCTLLPFVMPLHPLHFLFNKLHADVSPLPGHDGFDKPGGGSHFHYLHHAHFNCNYGTPMVPIDKLFGCYEDGSSYENKAKAQDK